MHQGDQINQAIKDKKRKYLFDAFKREYWLAKNSRYQDMACNNLSNTASQLGLQKKSLLYLNESIAHGFGSCAYANRAEKFRVLHLDELMFRDLEKVTDQDDLEFKYRTLAKFYTEKCQFEKAEEFYNKAIDNCSTSKKWSPTLAKARFYQAIDKNSKAIEILKDLYKEDKSRGILLHLGLAHFKAGDVERAKKIHQQYAESGGLKKFYTKETNSGVITHLDKDKNHGFALTTTRFNGYEFVEFRTTDSELLKDGQVFSSELHYQQQTSKLVPTIKNPRLLETWGDLGIGVGTYEGLVLKQNCLFNSESHELVAKFYRPVKKFIPLYLITKFLSKRVLDVLNRESYCFFKVFVTKSEQLEFRFRLLNYKNSDQKWTKSKSSKPKMRFESNDSWCPVCQQSEWCGTDGCPFDPT